MPFWPAQQPWYLPGASEAGVNEAASYHSLTPPGTTNVTWRVTGTINGDFPPAYQQLLPCYSYPICCPYPGFPGIMCKTSQFNALYLVKFHNFYNCKN